jgi:hypothetical protein
MDERIHVEKKPAARTLPDSYDRILVGRREAARMLSISQRSLDYLVAKRQLNVRRIGARVLISMNELKRYARADHPRPLADRTKEIDPTLASARATKTCSPFEPIDRGV